MIAMWVSRASFVVTIGESEQTCPLSRIGRVDSTAASHFALRLKGALADACRKVDVIVPTVSECPVAFTNSNFLFVQTFLGQIIH